MTSAVRVDAQWRRATARTCAAPTIPTSASASTTGSDGFTDPSSTPEANVSSVSWGEIVGSWRYLGYNMKSGEGLQDLSFNGPMLSAVFHW